MFDKTNKKVYNKDESKEGESNMVENKDNKQTEPIFKDKPKKRPSNRSIPQKEKVASKGTESSQSKVPRKRPVRTVKEKPTLKGNTKMLIGIGGLIILFIITGVLFVIGNNLRSNLDNRLPTGEDVRKQVGRETYDKLEKEYLEQQKELDSQERERLLEEQRLKEEQRRVQLQIEDEELEEGNGWYYDVQEGKMKQRPLEDYDKGRVKDIEDQSYELDIEILPPAQNVIDMMAKHVDDINLQDVLITKGQFIFWAQDNLLTLVGDSDISTKWDPDTHTLTVTTVFGDKERVENLTRKKIEMLYEHSLYNEEGKPITIVYN